MRAITTIFATATLVVSVIASAGESRSAPEPLAPFENRNHQAAAGALQANSLCARSEHVIFSCRVTYSAKRSQKSPLKIASLCSSRHLDKESGYLQYRFGLPGKIELEFPSARTGTQQMFQYTHYMRYQVDLTEITFQLDGYEYQIFDAYNGEEKPAVAEQGVKVTAPGVEKEVSFVCRSKLKADYSMLHDVLTNED